MTKKEIGAEILSALDKHMIHEGISKTQLSKELGMSPQLLRQYESKFKNGLNVGVIGLGTFRKYIDEKILIAYKEAE